MYLSDKTQPYISSTLVFCCTLYISAVQISYHQVGARYLKTPTWRWLIITENIQATEGRKYCLRTFFEGHMLASSAIYSHLFLAFFWDCLAVEDGTDGLSRNVVAKYK